MLLPQVCCLKLEEIVAHEVAFAVSTENHIGGGYGEHPLVHLDAMELVAAYVVALLRCAGFLQHLLHRRHEETARAAAGVEYLVGRFEVKQFAE